MCALHCALCTALNFIASAHECKIHCLLASVNFMLALLSQNFLVSSGKLILPKMLRISQQKNSKARSRCFQVPQHTKSLYQLKNKIYLFRFSHTNALLFQKIHKIDIFPLLQKLTHISYILSQVQINYNYNALILLSLK